MSIDYSVYTLKQRRLDKNDRAYLPVEMTCERCSFFTDRITVAFVHAYQKHGDRTSPTKGTK